MDKKLETLLKFLDSKINYLNETIEYAKLKKDNGLVDFCNQDLLPLCDIKVVIQQLKDFEKFKAEICEMFGLDNLYPYNNVGEIINKLHEHLVTNSGWQLLALTRKHELEVAKKEALKLYKMVERAGNGKGFNLNDAWACYKKIKAE